jgi:hypothetical protein
LRSLRCPPRRLHAVGRLCHESSTSSISAASRFPVNTGWICGGFPSGALQLLIARLSFSLLLQVLLGIVDLLGQGGMGRTPLGPDMPCHMVQRSHFLQESDCLCNNVRHSEKLMICCCETTSGK